VAIQGGGFEGDNLHQLLLVILNVCKTYTAEHMATLRRHRDKRDVNDLGLPRLCASINDCDRLNVRRGELG
jgi:hypothetical protein